jgi:hypothetical protein
VPTDEVHFQIEGSGHPFRIEDIDASVSIHPQSGTAPAEITVRNRTQNARRFQFTLVHQESKVRRVVTGHLVRMDWTTRLCETSPDAWKPSQPIGELVRPIGGGDLRHLDLTETRQSINEVTLSRSRSASIAEAKGKPSNWMLAVATTNSALPTGEYFAQIYGIERSYLEVNERAIWDASTRPATSTGSIDSTLRISIRKPSVPWTGAAVSTGGDISFWQIVRPVPTLP